MYVNIYICRSETLGKDRCTASTDNGKDRCTASTDNGKDIVVQCSIQCSISTIGKDRCTVTMESASDRRRRLARERLQRCNLADLKLFLAILDLQHTYPCACDNADFCCCSCCCCFVVSCNWFFPTNHKSVLVLFLFTCILYCMHCILIVARGFPAHAYT